MTDLSYDDKIKLLDAALEFIAYAELLDAALEFIAHAEPSDLDAFEQRIARRREALEAAKSREEKH